MPRGRLLAGPRLDPRRHVDRVRPHDRDGLADVVGREAAGQHHPPPPRQRRRRRPVGQLPGPAGRVAGGGVDRAASPPRGHAAASRQRLAVAGQRLDHPRPRRRGVRRRLVRRAAARRPARRARRRAARPPPADRRTRRPRCRNGGSVTAMARAASASIARGLPGANTKPIAAAPRSAAAHASTARVMPQNFIAGRRHAAHPHELAAARRPGSGWLMKRSPTRNA